MTVISFEKLEKLFPGYDQIANDDVVSVQPAMGPAGLFDFIKLGRYITDGKASGLLITVVSQFEIMGEGDSRVSLGGPAYILEIYDRNERDETGARGMTVNKFLDVRDDTPKSMKPGSAFRTLSALPLSVQGLTETLAEIKDKTGLPESGVTIVDCMRACPAHEYEARNGFERRLAQLRRNVDTFSYVLLPEFAHKAMLREATPLEPKPPSWRDGEPAPGGGATVLSLNMRRSNG